MSNKFLNYKRYDLSHTDAEILQRGGWLTSDILQFAFACLCNNDDGSLSHDRFGFLNPLTIMMLTGLHSLLPQMVPLSALQVAPWAHR